MSSPKMDVFFIFDATGVPLTGQAHLMSFLSYKTDLGVDYVPHPTIIEIGGGAYGFLPLFPVDTSRAMVYVLSTGAYANPTAITRYMRPEDYTTDVIPNVQALAQDIKDFNEGRWQIVTSGPDINRMLVFAPDGLTVIKRFNLYDRDGMSTFIEPFQRSPVIDTVVPPVPVSPYFVIDGLIASWDVSSLDLYFNHGEYITTLPDLTGNGHDLMQKQEESRPMLYKGAYGYHSALQFSGNEFMHNTSIYGAGNTWTTFFAFQYLTGEYQSPCPLFDFLDNIIDTSMIGLDAGSWFVENLDVGPTATGSAGDMGWHFGFLSCSPNGISLSLDIIENVVLSSAYPYVAPMNAFILGGMLAGTANKLNGFISEVSIKAGAYTADDIDDWYSHCALKYGRPS